MQKYRTHHCSELRKEDENKRVTLSGWVNTRRDHGGVIFIDLRDCYGLTQVTFDPKISEEAWKMADEIRSEFVVRVEGKVVLRPADMKNEKLVTGEIEVEAEKIDILSRSKVPPFEVAEIEGVDKAKDVKEELRLEYRFVDLRRKKMQEMLRAKDLYFQTIRKYFQEKDFVEVQTPILANSSPEGARDFLIPSRLYPGKFYALPQAPQQFKQLLMVGGTDKYFQIAPCFRDEDPRMDRAYGEFYQLDMEMSFVEQEDVFDVMEPLFLELVEKFSDKKLVGLDENGRFRRISWKDSMNKYGIDKPDLRFDMEIKPITEMISGCGFGVFADVAAKGGVVHALKVDGGAKFSRKEIDELTEIAKGKGAKGLAYIVLKEEGEMQSPIVKFLGEDLARNIVGAVDARFGDIIFFGADEWRTVCDALGAVRNECGLRLGLKDKTKGAFCWIVDFPMFSESEIEKGRIDFEHNPFSMPQGGLDALNTEKPLDIFGFQYDIVFNGFESLSGAIRNHEPETMYKAFEIAGYGKETVEARFGGMIKAFQYGAPPHGGCAIGVDRFFMVLNDMDSIRDIYAFPKDGKGKDLMMDSPAEVDEMQLREVHIKLRKA
ncbi:MAG: aspartate--tRNA ligase [Candidatus Pacebacteria bacterium]|nr:aspartate--tRNA ligase [Candidatus Paceibacterota bacterium]